MNTLDTALTGQYKADCKVDIIEPRKQDSMFPTYVIVKLLPNGLGLSFDSNRASGLDGFTKAAIIGEYQWLNSVDNINPFIMYYKDIDIMVCQFYETKGNMTSFVSQTQEIIEELPEKYDLNIVIVYHNKAKGTKLQIRLILKDINDKIDNKQNVIMFNSILSAKSSN